MPRQINRLTVAEVRRLHGPGLYPDGCGLYLQVSASGSRSWIFRFTLSGRQRYLGLGSEQSVTLAEARLKAAEARRSVAQGHDPIDVKRGLVFAPQSPGIPTFRQAAQSCMAALGPNWHSEAYAAQWRNSLATYVYPLIGDLPVDAVDTNAVLRVIGPIWNSKPDTANRVRLRIQTILDWCAARGMRTAENPARWEGHLDKLLPRRSRVRQVQHFAALPYPEIPGFIQLIRSQEPSPIFRALEFAILTAARSGEILGARWGEFDLAERVWTVSAQRMKSGKSHRSPLSQGALAVLQNCEPGPRDAFVFARSHPARPLHNMAVLNTLRRIGAPHLTVHGFRSTFRDWAAEETNFAGEVADMALAHVVANKVEAAYRRGDLFAKRQALMRAWDLFCRSQSAASHGGFIAWATSSWARTLGLARRLGAAA